MNKKLETSELEFAPLPSPPFFYMLIGLPAAGKSTWTNMMQAKTDEGFVVLSTDNIVERIAREINSTYSAIWSEVIDDATKENYANFRRAVQDRKDIIWDQTNLTKRKRENVLKQIPHEYTAFAVTFELPLEDILTRVENRAKETGKNIPKKTLINMFETYQKPTLNEGFDEIINN